MISGSFPKVIVVGIAEHRLRDCVIADIGGHIDAFPTNGPKVGANGRFPFANRIGLWCAACKDRQ
jgi:hypothetical protein